MRQLKILSILFFIAFFITNAKAQKQAPGLDVLGFGYDVFGEYANQKSKKRFCLFKYDNFKTVPIGSKQYNVPQYVILEYMSEHIVKTIEGSSMRQYAKSQAASVGLTKKGFFFKGSVNASFSKSSSGTKKHYYYTYRDANTKWRISFDDRQKNKLESMLDPVFVKDLNNPNLSPSELFERYGTHFIASAYLGGRADFNAKSVMTSNTSTSAIATAVKAKYGSVSGNASLSQSQKNTLSKSKTETKLVVTGGNSEYVNNIDDPVTYDKWASGISDMPVLCDFDENSLKPIWIFCRSKGRKAELKAEFERMIKANPLPEPMAASMQVSNQVYFIKNVGDGMYMDIPGYHFNAKIQAPVNVYPKDNVSGHGGRQGIDRFIKLIPHATDPNYVYLRPQHSDRVFDILFASKKAGAGLNLAYKRNKPEKLFKLIEVDGKDNTYYIENKNSGLVLTSNGKSKQITQEKNTKSEKQQWYLEPADAEDMAPMKTFQSYALRNVEANRYVDVGGSGANARTKNERVQLWDKSTNPDRYISLANTNLDDWYYVRHNHSSEHYWDIESGNNANGTKLQLWTKNEKPQQHFKFIYAGSAMTFYIQNRDSKKYLDASRSRLGKNGCPVQIWSRNGNDNQKWKLEPAGPVWFVPEKPIRVKVKSAFSNLTWNLKHGGAEKARQKNSKLDIHNDSKKGDRYVTITPSGDGSYIHLTTWMVNGQEKMRLGVDGNPSEKDNYLITWTPHGGNPQKFRIHPTGRNTCVIYTTGWKTLDIEGWGYNEPGSDIQTYNPHWKYNQQFQLIDASTGKPIDFRKYIK